MRLGVKATSFFKTSQLPELVFWLGALIALAISDPTIDHFTLCPVANMGFDWCPGCGLGTSISYAFNGQFVKSFFSHPLGIVGIIIICHRIIQIFRKQNLKS